MFSKGFKDFVLNLKQRPQKQLRTLRLLWFSKITVASIVLILRKNLKNYERFDCSDSQKYRVRARLSNLWFDYQKSKQFSTNNRMVSRAYWRTKLHHRAPASQRGTVPCCALIPIYPWQIWYWDWGGTNSKFNLINREACWYVRAHWSLHSVP